MYRRRVVIALSIGLILLIGLVICSEIIGPMGVVKSVKKALNEISKSEITTVDVTGIILGKETQHEHVYKTMYDESKHWEECSVCGIKKNEKTHTLTTTWVNGTESCEKNNSYTKICICGYSEIGHKPCVWDGKSYGVYTSVMQHWKMCKICKGAILYSYYLNEYGNGNLYTLSENSYLRDSDGENCVNSVNQEIICNRLGKCSICSTNYYQKVHYLKARENTIYCCLCGQEYGSINTTITTDSNAPITYKVVNKISLTNGAKFHSTAGMRTTGNPWESNVQTVSDKNSVGTEYILTTTAKFKGSWKKKFLTYLQAYVSIDGIKCAFQPIAATYIYPDLQKPTISTILLGSSSSWSKSRTITIIGTENYCNAVKVEILDDKNNEIYSGRSTTNNGNYSIECTPELEAGSKGRIFKVVVTDDCDNVTEKEFTISKIDSIAPEVTSGDKVSDGWAREKNFIFTASDLGIGNVQIGFNDVNDYKLANKNGTEYSREYKLIGDVYSPREANVYYKDELGNVSTKKVIIDKIDNTAPSITGASFSNNKLNVTAHDRHQTEGEGSGVSKYRFMTSVIKLENPEITLDNGTEVLVNENIIVPDIYKVKYVYVVAEDAVRKCK